MYGCGCFICTGHDKEGRMNITEKLIDKEAIEEVNDFILPDVINCKHENELTKQGDGFTYVVCKDCGEDL